MLTEPEVDALIALTFLLSPDELNGKVIFCVSTILEVLIYKKDRNKGFR